MAFKPVTAANACIRRSRRMLALAQENLPDPKIKNDLRRSALVLATSAIDSYMHWLVYRRLSEVRREGDLPKSLAKIDIPFTDLASLADSAIRARQQDHDIRPWVQVKNSMQTRILRETFQSYEQVGQALSMPGIEKAWSRVGAKMGCEPNAIRVRLNRIVQRRNQIVHEGDIARSSRPQRLKYNKLKHDEITDDVDWIETLIEAIRGVIADVRAQ